MAAFALDRDLMRWEPVLFGTLHRGEQQLAGGTQGQLDGTTFTTTEVNFTDQGIQSGMVLYACDPEGTLENCLDIISVDDGQTLTVSVMRADDDDPAIAPPSGQDLTWRVTSYRAQIVQVSAALMQYFGLEADDLLTLADPSQLTQAATLAAMAVIFAGTAAGQDDAGLWEKSRHYHKQFHEAREKLRLDIDANQDGIVDQQKLAGSVRLMRG